MSAGWVDLRSDTVTLPSERMRRAMAEAEVGDDVYREDPTVRRLEERSAELMGHEAALFVPSGTMGNQIALSLHGRRGQEVLCEAESHIVHYEMGAMAALAGLMAKGIPTISGQLEAGMVEAGAVRPSDHHPGTGVVALENTHNLAGGTVYTAGAVAAVAAAAHRHRLPVHLDGARIWNAAVACGIAPADFARCCDSVMFCLSKGLGAPIGSMLCGGGAFIEEARRVRKLFGGGMRQAGVIAAAGLVALEDGPDRLHHDHELARRLAEGLADLPGVVLDPAAVVTNMVLFRLAGDGAGRARGFVGALAERGVRGGLLLGERVRLVTHRDVDAAGIGRALDAAREILKRGREILKGGT